MTDTTHLQPVGQNPAYRGTVLFFERLRDFEFSNYRVLEISGFCSKHPYATGCPQCSSRCGEYRSNQVNDKLPSFLFVHGSSSLFLSLEHCHQRGVLIDGKLIRCICAHVSVAAWMTPTYECEPFCRICFYSHRVAESVFAYSFN